MTAGGRKYGKLGKAIRIPATAKIEYSDDDNRVHVFGSIGGKEFCLTLSIETLAKLRDGEDVTVETLAEFKRSMK